MNNFNLDEAIRKVPDFPKPGILFYDITSIFTNTKAFAYCIDAAVEILKDKDFDLFLAVESRGFIFTSVLAYKLGKPFTLARKKGKLPGETISETYSLEYGTATLEIHTADLLPGSKVVIIDDLIATGGTLRACADMIEKSGSKVASIFGIIGLPFLEYNKKIGEYHVDTLINYLSE